MLAHITLELHDWAGSDASRQPFVLLFTLQRLKRLFGHFVEEEKKTLKAAKLTLTSFAPSREAAETDQGGGTVCYPDTKTQPQKGIITDSRH